MFSFDPLFDPSGLPGGGVGWLPPTPPWVGVRRALPSPPPPGLEKKLGSASRRLVWTRYPLCCAHAAAQPSPPLPSKTTVDSFLNLSKTCADIYQFLLPQARSKNAIHPFSRLRCHYNFELIIPLPPFCTSTPYSKAPKGVLRAVTRHKGLLVQRGGVDVWYQCRITGSPLLRARGGERDDPRAVARHPLPPSRHVDGGQAVVWQGDLFFGTGHRFLFFYTEYIFLLRICNFLVNIRFLLKSITCLSLFPRQSNLFVLPRTFFF